MNKIEHLFDEFFNSSDKSQASQIINEIMSLKNSEKSEFFHLYVANLQYLKQLTTHGMVLAKEHGKFEEFGLEMSRIS